MNFIPLHGNVDYKVLAFIIAYFAEKGKIWYNKYNINIREDGRYYWLIISNTHFGLACAGPSLRAALRSFRSSLVADGP